MLYPSAQARLLDAAATANLFGGACPGENIPKQDTTALPTMDVHSPFIDALRSATDDWLAAHDVPRALSHPHYLYEAPGQPRSDAQALFSRQEQELEHIYKKFESIMQDGLDKILRLRSQVNQRLAPIQSLPPELLSEVFKFVVPRQEKRGHRSSIIQLSHVSQTWRGTVLGISSFFCSADWNEWPAWLCREWYVRAQGHPLKVSLDDNGLQRMSSGSPFAFDDLMEETKRSWSYLKITVSVATSGHALLHHHFPQVSTLVVKGYAGTDITLRSCDLPNIRDLRLEGPLVDVFHNDTFPNLRNLVVSSLRQGWSRILDAAIGLESLSLSYDGSLSLDDELASRTMPELKHLNTTSMRTRNIQILFEKLTLPNLSSFKINRIKTQNFSYAGLPNVSTVRLLVFTSPSFSLHSLSMNQLPILANYFYPRRLTG